MQSSSHFSFLSLIFCYTPHKIYYMSEKTIFSRIIDGEIPAFRLYEDDQCIAILDVFPASPGHVLVIPKESIDHWYDVSPDLYAHLMRVARILSQALLRIYPDCRIIQLIEGFEVPHTHIHLIPSTVGLRHLSRPSQMSPQVELSATQSSILLALSDVSA